MVADDSVHVDYAVAPEPLPYPESAPPTPRDGHSDRDVPRDGVSDNYATVTVYYGTDRSTQGRDDKGVVYGTGRGELQFGRCDVAIPRDHRMGELESPKWYKFEFREDPAKHVMILSAKTMSREDFAASLAAATAKSRRHEALVFIHGFNVTFEDAARRTAQISYDIGFDGPAAFYSWPSQGSAGPVAYMTDENNVQWSVPHLAEFLTLVRTQSGAESIHLVAHSMGNRALTGALGAMPLPADGKPLFQEVVLACADIDADVFKTQIAPAIRGKGERLTIYASENDGALKASKTVHTYSRVGDGGSAIVVLPGFDTVEVSALDTGLLGHSYVSEERSVISDIYYLVRDRLPPDRRHGLRPVVIPAGTYWQFRR